MKSEAERLVSWLQGVVNERRGLDAGEVVELLGRMCKVADEVELMGKEVAAMHDGVNEVEAENDRLRDDNRLDMLARRIDLIYKMVALREKEGVS